MEWHGITIDLPWFGNRSRNGLPASESVVEGEIYAAAGQEFNINSNRGCARFYLIS